MTPLCDTPFIVRVALAIEDFIFRLFPNCTEAKLARAMEEALRQ